MPGFLLLSSWLCIFVVLAVIAQAFIRRDKDLLSIRNFFLLGFLYFYPLASILYVHGGGGDLPRPGITTLAAGQLLFLAAYFVGEFVGRPFHRLSNYMPSVPINPSSPALLTGIGVLAVLSVGSLAMAGDTTGAAGYLKVAVMEFRSAFGAAAVGLATYYLIGRRFSPLAWAVFLGAFAFASLATLAGTGGRRGWLSVALAVIWIWYYFRLRQQSTAAIALKSAVPVTIGLLFLIAYSAVRHSEDARQTTITSRAQQVREMVTNPRINSDVIISNLRQDSAYNTVFIAEHYPDYYNKDVLEGALFVIVNPFPRALWPGKPMGLGVELQEQMQAQANLAPGIIGHGWAEAQWIGIVYYGVFFGAFCVLLDRAVQRLLWSPFAIAAIGCQLGNIFALARGDTPLFFVHILTGIAGVFILFFVIRLAFGKVFDGFIPVIPPGAEAIAQTYDDGADDTFTDEYAGYEEGVVRTHAPDPPPAQRPSIW
ncbi:MAG: hypothetical protein JJU33_02720 [Phycisphaerales bacterium]|nr:hypothetical protein [Phycisphaerales bacterium]